MTSTGIAVWWQKSFVFWSSTVVFVKAPWKSQSSQRQTTAKEHFNEYCAHHDVRVFTSSTTSRLHRLTWLLCFSFLDLMSLCIQYVSFPLLTLKNKFIIIIFLAVFKWSWVLVAAVSCCLSYSLSYLLGSRGSDTFLKGKFILIWSLESPWGIS